MEGRRRLAQAAACGCDGGREPVRPDVPVKALPARPEQPERPLSHQGSSAAPLRRDGPGLGLGSAWGWAQS